MDPGYSAQWTAQDVLGLAPTSPAGGNYTPPDVADFGTVPPAPQLPPVYGASDAFTAFHGPMVMAAVSTYQQTFISGDPSPVVIGDRMFRPQYTPLSQVAFAAFDATHRTWNNLLHPPPVTADRNPRPDWNPFATLQNYPMKAVAGLQTVIFGGPQQTKVTGRP